MSLVLKYDTMYEVELYASDYGSELTCRSSSIIMEISTPEYQCKLLDKINIAVAAEGGGKRG